MNYILRAPRGLGLRTKGSAPFSFEMTPDEKLGQFRDNFPGDLFDDSLGNLFDGERAIASITSGDNWLRVIWPRAAIAGATEAAGSSVGAALRINALRSICGGVVVVAVSIEGSPTKRICARIIAVICVL